MLQSREKKPQRGLSSYSESTVRIARDVPFLSPSKSTASSSSLHRHVGHGTVRYGLGHQVYSQPTIAPASVQVHYHYLAGRYRDLSYERGLGLLSPSAVPSTLSSVSNLLDNNENLEKVVEEKESPSKSSSISLTPNGKNKSASNSLRLIAKRTGIDDDASSPRRRVASVSLEIGKFKDKEEFPSSIFDQKGKSHQSTRHNGLTLAAAHGAKYGSLRSYAEDRIKAQEIMEGRIQRATDTGRLKWEAKAAMLNNAYPLAILLYTRAAQLGSVTAALALTKIYCTGITKGKNPMVILNNREPLLALSWALEAVSILQDRHALRIKRKGPMGDTREEDSDSNQEKEIVSLFARLLRCRELHLIRQEDVILPKVRTMGTSRRKEDVILGWQSVCESMSWLEKRLIAAEEPSIHDFNDDESIGPDDDHDDDKGDIGKVNDEGIQVALIHALVATRRWATSSDDEMKYNVMQGCWTELADSLQNQKRQQLTDDGSLGEVVQWCRRLHKSSAKEVNGNLDELIDLLNASLVESNVPVAIASCIGAQYDHNHSLRSPDNRKAAHPTTGKLSLEKLSASHARAREKQPALLRKVSSSVQPLAITANGSHAAGDSRHLLQRAASFSGLQYLQSSYESDSKYTSNGNSTAERQTSRMQMVRRPSSVMSDSPSLLFPHEGEGTVDERVPVNTITQQQVEASPLPSPTSLASSLWKAAPAQTRQPHSSTLRKERIASMYSTASVAPSEPIHTEGSTTFDYDIDTSLRRQQARRKRGDSNASISTMASMLSTNPSISESMAGTQHARGQFTTASISSDIEGLEVYLNGAVNSLQRIRKANGISVEKPMPQGTVAPRLNETLEQLIANSTSYRAVQSRSTSNSNKQQSLERVRKASNASMKSLIAFTATNHRQGAHGNLTSPSLYQGANRERALSVFNVPITLSSTISKSTSFCSPVSAVQSNVSRIHVNGNEDKGRRGAIGALGSLRLLSKENSRRGQSANCQQLSNGREGVSRLSITSKTNEREVNTEAGCSKRAFDVFDPTFQHYTSTSSSATNSMHGDHLNHSHSHSNSDFNSHSHLNNDNHLDPALTKAEENSGLKTTSNCQMCSQKVVNAPMTKSGEVFCSRNCRIERQKQKVNGKVDFKGKTREIN